MSKKVKWNGAVQPEAIEVMNTEGGVIVSPTKVGYIIMTKDMKGLERKFAAKRRKRSKPAVALCGSLEEFRELALYDEKILKLYEMHWEQDVLLGCILPWSEKGRERLRKAGTEELATDERGTSCFVVKFGKPSELIAKKMWDDSETICFASSANPSGVGNKGKVANIGERIDSMVDLVIDGDEYVHSIQPNESEETRYEQGVMLSFVDDQGKLLVDGQSPYPMLIRRGLDCDKIMRNMSKLYNSWDYRHGAYH